MKLIVGLGNPGKEYATTRHNIGFMVIDGIAKEEQVALRKNILQRYSAGTLHHERDTAYIVKPLDYMNNSGRVVKMFVKKYGISLSNVLVVCDDLDLPVGKIRFRTNGSDGGHRGLRSVIQTLQSNEFSRLRVGIGRPERQNDTKDFVLSRFAGDEKETVDKSLNLSIFTCKEWFFCGITKNITYTVN